MPEGPEVEAARKLVSRHLAGHKIVRAVVADDPKVFMERSPAEVQQALEGRIITAARRKAKYLWLELDGKGPKPLLHFGMTGSVQVQGASVAHYKRVKPDEIGWPPKFCKLELQFEGGAAMAFSDPRRFGRVQLLDDPANQEPVSKLGFDVIDELPDLEEFSQRLAAYQRPGSTLRIKALLLDQSFTAGVGNWVADEVLYQARIHPEQPVADMTPEQVQATHKAIKYVMQVATEADADDSLFPKNWLFHYRWTGKKASSVDGHAVHFATVGSRTSAFVPALQKLIAGTGLSKQKLERKVVKRMKVVAETSIDTDADEAAAPAEVVVTARKRTSRRRDTKVVISDEDVAGDSKPDDVTDTGVPAVGDKVLGSKKDQEGAGLEVNAPPRKGKKARGTRRKGQTADAVAVEVDAAVTAVQEVVEEVVEEDGVGATSVTMTKRRRTMKSKAQEGAEGAAPGKAAVANRTRGRRAGA